MSRRSKYTASKQTTQPRITAKLGRLDGFGEAGSFGPGLHWKGSPDAQALNVGPVEAIVNVQTRLSLCQQGPMPNMSTDKKSKKRQEVLNQKLQKLQLLLTGAKQQKDDIDEIKRFEKEIAEIKQEMATLKG